MKLLALSLLLVLYSASVAAAAPRPNKEAPPPAVQYDLTVNVQPDAHRLESTAVVQIPPAASERQTLSFTLYADMADVRATVLAPPACAGPAALQIIEKDQGFVHNRRWELKPAHPLPKDTPISLQIQYSGGQKQSFEFYLGPEGSFASAYGCNWYPRFGQMQETGTMRFTVPKGYTVKATGLTNPLTGDGAEPRFAFRVEQPTRFSFAAGRYVVHRREGRVPVTLYLLKDRPFAEGFVEGIRKAHRVLENEFGPYPFGEYAVVETPSPQSDLSGFSGASLAGFMFADTQTMDGGFNLAFFGHEMSHQWWGNLVTHDGDKGGYMLDEAMAQYGSLRCVEAIDGPEMAARYRSIGYPGYDLLQDGRGALLFAAAGVDDPLGALPSGGNSHFMADSKGFLVYAMLARTIGHERFHKALKHITSAYAFRSITWETFLQEIQRAAGQDLTWFYIQWFERKGVPLLSLQWTQEGSSLRVTLSQAAPFYRLMLPVQIEYDDGEAVLQQVSIDGQKAERVYPARRRVRAVRLDPYDEVLHMTPETKEKWEALRPWMQGYALEMMGKTDEALQVYRQNLPRLPETDRYGTEFLLHAGIGDLQRRAGHLEEAKGAYERALACPTRWPDYLPSVYYGLAQIAKSQNDSARLAWAIRCAVSADHALDFPTGAGQQATQLLESQSHP